MRMFVCLLMMLVAAPAIAADWQVSRVRGEVTQQVNGAWKAVNRGDAIPNDRYLQTGENGRVGLSRGKETIELEGNTQIRIKDAGADLMTTVLQDFGAVSIEAERRNVQHFSVQTPFLAAVVKGTRFTVRSDARGATVVVNRGVVQVQDTVNKLVVDVRPGQEASVTRQAPLLVEGAGAVSVFSFEGVQVINGTTTAVEDAAPNASANANAGGKASRGAVSNAGGNGNGVGQAVSAAVSNAGGNGNGVGQSVSNAGGNGKSNAGGNGNGNAGGNGNGNSGKNDIGSAVNDTLSSVVGTLTGDDEGKTNNAGGLGKGNAFGLGKN